MARIAVTSFAGASLLAAVGAAMSVSAAAKPMAGDFGNEYCALNNCHKVGGVTVLGDERKCCFWEKTGENEGIRVCLQCDANWKNCEDPFLARAQLSTPPNSCKAGPAPGRSGAGTPARRLNRKLELQRQVE